MAVFWHSGPVAANISKRASTVVGGTAASDEDGEIVQSVEAGVATFAGKRHGTSNILLKFVDVRVAEVFLGFEGGQASTCGRQSRGIG